MTSEKPVSYDDVRKSVKPKSIYDRDVDYEKVLKLSPADRARLFPNDFSPSGEPYGDF